MNKNEFCKINIEVISTLKNFNDLAQGKNNLIILGSIALLSYTQKINYFRKIKDVDAIVDVKYKEFFETNFISLGYSKSTFIDKKMPFSFILRRFAGSKYIRFYKSNGVDIEILFTHFNFKKEFLEIELFPNLYVSLPANELVKTELCGVNFNSLTPEAIMVVNQLARNTFGKLYKNAFEKRNTDKKMLLKVINTTKYRSISTKLGCRFLFLSIPLLQNVLRID